jgi:Glutaminase
MTPRSRLFPLRSGERRSIVSNCAECGQELGRGRRHRRFCSDKCRYRYRDRVRYAADPENEREKSRRYYRANRERVQTKNNPSCQVWWGWHVGSTICVRGPGLLQKQDMVIDPSLFTTPVSKATWKSVQGDLNATLTDSAASIFYLWGGVTDPTYVQTNQVLATYRLQLQNRSIQQGSPPYPQCP